MSRTLSREAKVSLSLVFGYALLVACSSGLGRDPRVRPGPPVPPSARSANLPVGVDLGAGLTSPIAITSTALGGAVLPAVGATPARPVLFVAFTTPAAANDLAREPAADGNGADDVFLAAVVAADVDTSAFSRALAGKFRHPRCATCHSMQVTGTLAFLSSALPHAGPPPGPTFPNNDAATCTPCHTSATTAPVPTWQAPRASFDIRSKSVAQLAQMAQNVPVDDTEHFVSDARVLWALNSGVTPTAGGRNGAADDDHDGVVEPEDSDGVPRPVPGGSIGFLRDLAQWQAGGRVVSDAGAVADVELVSRTAGGAAGNGASRAPSLVWFPNPLFNGTTDLVAGTVFVAFESDASDLTAGDGNGATDVFRVAIQVRLQEDATGAPVPGRINLRALPGINVLASAVDGQATAGNGASRHAVIGGASGELVAFESLATNLVGGFADANAAGAPDVFVRNVANGETDLVSHATTGAVAGGNGASSAPAISADGVAIAFESDAANLVAADGNGARDVFFATTTPGPVFTLARASVRSGGVEGTGGASRAASVARSGTGRTFVAFESDKRDLDPAATAATNVFLFDSDGAGTTTLLNQQVAPAAGGAGNVVRIGDGSARAPVITQDGAVVVFTSEAANLDVLRAADQNNRADVFVVERGPIAAAGVVLPFRISVTSEGADADGPSSQAMAGSFAGGSAEFGVGFAGYLTDATNLGTSDNSRLVVSFLAERSGVLASFTAAPQVGPAPLTVQFTDASTGTPTAWEWDLDGDGVVDSTVQNPQFTYQTPGTFDVRLRARSATNSGETTEVGFVRALGPVVAAFEPSVTQGVRPLSVTFTDQSTELPDTWAWDFDNNGTVDSTVQNPTFVYANAGTFTVRLVATGPSGSDEEIRTNLITAHLPVVASFNASPSSGQAPLNVQFTDTSSGNPTSWQWDFDNNGTVDSTAQNPSHVYASVANFTARLTVTGPGGTNSTTRAISAQGAMSASFTANPPGGIAPLNVQFTDTSTGSPTGWQWDFDDNGTVDSTLQNPSRQFTVPGDYPVRLTITRSGFTNATVLIADPITVVLAMETVTIAPLKDNTMFSHVTTNSNGAGAELFAGRAVGAFGSRRALLEFTITGNVPAGATILGAELQLTSERAFSATSSSFTVHRVTTEWGEAGSNAVVTGTTSNTGGGAGAPAQNGDATWASAMHGSVAWGTSGGDFAVASDTASLGALGVHSWTSAAMANDVDLWLNTPSQNHGWLIKAVDEANPNARRFHSRTSGTSSARPKLIVTFRRAF